MTFRQFLLAVEGMWGSKGQFSTGLTTKTSPGQLAKHDLNNWPVYGQGKSAPAPAAGKKMKR